jgi:L-alanine-DL-glutamate epimerase-like enolase superfamily enzyme
MTERSDCVVESVRSFSTEGAHEPMFENAFGGMSRSLIVEVELRNGKAGRGEATLLPGWSGEWPRASEVLLDDVLRPTIVGRHAASVASRARAALAANNFLIWALEAAALDALGVSVPFGALPVRGLVGCVDSVSAARLAASQRASGYQRLKVKLEGAIAEDARRLRAVREAAPTAVIVADANGAIKGPDLESFCAIFRETAVAAVEQPCSRRDVLEGGLPEADGWLWVADESIWTYEDALTLRDGPWHVWTLHPGKSRGEDVLEAIASLASAKDIAVVLGSNVEFGPGVAALCRVAARLPVSEAQLLIGHDLAGPVLIDGWRDSQLVLANGSIEQRLD